MLASLTVRDVVLIEKAELNFAAGLNVLTGETGAGKSILIDANALLMTDMPRASYVIERAYRNSFAFDARNSFIQSAKASDERTVFDVTAHYAQPRIPVPAPTTPGATPAPFYPPPIVLEDPRSLFLNHELSLLFYGKDDIAWLREWLRRRIDEAQPYRPDSPGLGRDLVEGMVRAVAFQL